MIQQEFQPWDEKVTAFVKEKQMSEEEEKEFLEEYDSYLFRGGLDDVEWFYTELYANTVYREEQLRKAIAPIELPSNEAINNHISI